MRREEFKRVVRETGVLLEFEECTEVGGLMTEAGVCREVVGVERGRVDTGLAKRSHLEGLMGVLT